MEDLGGIATALGEVGDSHERLQEHQLPTPQQDTASSIDDATKTRTKDRLKDWAPPKREECPICFLPLPLGMKIVNQLCCGKIICSGCVYGNAMAMAHGGISKANLSKTVDKCPFCRTLDSTLTEAELVSRVMKRAESGNAKDMWKLGGWFRTGTFGLKQNDEEAVRWCKKGADAGGAEATGALGVMYLDGHCGLEKDIERGIRLIERSAGLGHVNMFAHAGRGRSDIGDFEFSVLNFRKGAICGDDKCLSLMLPFFRGGCITKEEYLHALRAHQTASAELKSQERDAFIETLGPNGKWEDI